MSKPYNGRSLFGKLRYLLSSVVFGRSTPVDAKKDVEGAADLVVRAINIFKTVINNPRLSAFVLFTKNKLDDAAFEFLKHVLARVAPRVTGGVVDADYRIALQDAAAGIRALKDDGRDKAIRSLAAAAYQEELRQRGESVPSFSVAGTVMERKYQDLKAGSDFA